MKAIRSVTLGMILTAVFLGPGQSWSMDKEKLDKYTSKHVTRSTVLKEAEEFLASIRCTSTTSQNIEFLNTLSQPRLTTLIASHQVYAPTTPPYSGSTLHPERTSSSFTTTPYEALSSTPHTELSSLTGPAANDTLMASFKGTSLVTQSQTDSIKRKEQHVTPSPVLGHVPALQRLSDSSEPPSAACLTPAAPASSFSHSLASSSQFDSPDVGTKTSFAPLTKEEPQTDAYQTETVTKAAHDDQSMPMAAAPLTPIVVPDAPALSERKQKIKHALTPQHMEELKKGNAKLHAYLTSLNIGNPADLLSCERVLEATQKMNKISKLDLRRDQIQYFESLISDPLQSDWYDKFLKAAGAYETFYTLETRRTFNEEHSSYILHYLLPNCYYTGEHREVDGWKEKFDSVFRVYRIYYSDQTKSFKPTHKNYLSVVMPYYSSGKVRENLGWQEEFDRAFEAYELFYSANSPFIREEKDILEINLPWYTASEGKTALKSWWDKFTKLKEAAYARTH